MDYVFLVQEREFLRLNEQTYRVGKTTCTIDRLFSECPLGSRFILFCNVSDCHRVFDSICNVFDHLFEKRLEYGEHYYSGKLEIMKREFFICITNDLSGIETEIIIEESSSSETRPPPRQQMLRAIGGVSVKNFRK